MNRIGCIRLLGTMAVAATLAASPHDAHACEGGVCFQNVVQAQATQRTTTAPVFISYNTTPGSFPSAAEFVGATAPNVAGNIEVFPSGTKSEVSEYIAMVLPSAALANNEAYTLHVTADVTVCDPQAIQFEFTTGSLTPHAIPALALDGDLVTSSDVGPDTNSDCSDQDQIATRFSVSPTVTGDAPALYVLRVKDIYADAPDASVYPDFAIADVRESLPLLYDAAKDDSVHSARELCFIATAITGDGQFAMDTAEICQTIPAGGGPPSSSCPDGDTCDEEAGCGCRAGNATPHAAPLWWMGAGGVVMLLARRRR